MSEEKFEAAFKDQTLVEQFTIPGLNWHQKRAWPLLRKLWRDVLHTDPRWHFFWEGSYSLIRCSASHTKRVDEFFAAQKIKVQWDGLWKDPNPLVHKYQSLYEGMFHGFSEMAVHLSKQTAGNWKKDEFWLALDRIVHPFILMNYHWQRVNRVRYLLGPWHNSAPQYFEGLALGRCAVDRSYYQGYMMAQIKAQAGNKKGGGKKK